MKRRTFLLGAGSAAVGGGALLGSGAFTRVESQRSVTVEVAEDPNAYLGMDKCPGSPNASYASLDDDGHLRVLMNPENPTVGDSPLGEGINSDSSTWADSVFQVCNQGKEAVCLFIEDSENWPTVPEGETDAGERRVDFYLGADGEASIVGEDNAVALGLGECVCIGVRTRSHGLSAGDELLAALDNEIRIVADADLECDGSPDPEEPVLPSCPFYGTSRKDPTAVFSIEGDTGSSSISETQVGDIPDDFDNSNYPNGVAFDDTNDVWYFAEQNGVLKTMNEDDALGITEYDSITSGGPVAGATFFEGQYHFIPNGGDTLKTADISGGSVTVEDVTSLNWSNIGLGDLAVDRLKQTLYVSTVSSDAGAIFGSVDLNNLGDQQLIADGAADSFAVGKQIGFALGTLWAHEANGGEWYTVDVSDGSLSDKVAVTQEYTDLAQCGFAEYGDG